MATPKRRSLRDRDEQAIAAEVPAPPRPPVGPAVVPSPQAASPPMERATEKHPQPAAPRTPASARPDAAAAGGARIGIYFHPADFDDAKSAYLADWLDGGDADTFARWIAGALSAHAQRPPAERSALARPQERAATSGSTRSFSIPAQVVGEMHDAIGADQAAGRWPSDSAWCGDAVAAAVLVSRDRHTGPWPTPPTRLPNRLVRR